MELQRWQRVAKVLPHVVITEISLLLLQLPPLFVWGQAQHGLVLFQPRKLHAFIPKLLLLVLIPRFLTAQSSESAQFLFNLIQNNQTRLRKRKLWSQRGNHHLEMYEPRIHYGAAV